MDELLGNMILIQDKGPGHLLKVEDRFTCAARDDEHWAELRRPSAATAAAPSMMPFSSEPAARRSDSGPDRRRQRRCAPNSALTQERRYRQPAIISPRLTVPSQVRAVPR